jgi:glycosyltransferase involved in cell wall biosynthesis
VGEVAKLWPGKGQAELLQAFARCHPQVPHARLVFIGEGPEQARLERLAARLGIASHVRFAGFTLDVPSATHALDVAVLPSLFEGMGRTVVEAMACGKPVIASRVGGIPDVLPDGVAGMLVPPGDVEQLANALTRLLRDPDLRARMGQAGHHHVTGELTAAVMIQEILSVYRARLQDGPS